MAHWFGLHPWDVDRCTVNQTNRYVEWLKSQQSRTK